MMEFRFYLSLSQLSGYLLVCFRELSIFTIKFCFTFSDHSSFRYLSKISNYLAAVLESEMLLIFYISLWHFRFQLYLLLKFSLKISDKPFSISCFCSSGIVSQKYCCFAFTKIFFTYSRIAGLSVSSIIFAKFIFCACIFISLKLKIETVNNNRMLF